MPRGLAAFLKGFGVIAFVVGLGAVSSFAAGTTWTVKPGGSFTGTGLASFVPSGATGGIACFPSVVKGQLKHGSRLPGFKIGSLTTWTFSGCSEGSGTATKPLAIKLAGGFSHRLSLDSYTDGEAKGTVTGFKVTVSGKSCSAVIAGKDATSPARLSLTFKPVGATASAFALAARKLHVWHVQGCTGIVKNGQTITFVSAGEVSPSQQITSP
jgi:hypothetical protein